MRPLDGIRVLDFFWLGAGPMTSLILEHLGAEIIHIESRSRLDKIREGGPYPPSGPDIEHSGLFASLNFGKRGMTLNLAAPESRQVVFDLVRSCQVVTNNFKPHTMQRFGIGFDDLVQHRPDIVYITMSTMGEEGPCSSYGAYGSHLAAMAGFNGIAGNEGEVPVGFGSLFPDFSCNPLHASAAILAGLRSVSQTGQAVRIDMSQLESTLHLLGPALKTASATGEQPPRIGARHAWKAPHNVYPCEGGAGDWVMIAVSSDQEWAALANLVGAEAQGAWDSWRSLLARRKQIDALDVAIGSWTAKRSRWAASTELLAVGVPAWPVESVADQVERDPVLAPTFLKIPLEPGLEATAPRVPLRMSNTPDQVAPPPRLGEHTFDILSELCGYSEEHIAELMASGALN